ncbi:MAG: NAD(P)-dependent oxidoreductase [bacterium]|nr:NAD(P)-dependent oxidoreductase [bacterium]
MRHETGLRCTKRLRVKLPDAPGWLGRLVTRMGEFGARFGEIVTIHNGKRDRIRDLDVTVQDEGTFDRMCDAIREMEGIDLIAVTDVVRERHLGGKIEMVGRAPIHSADDLGIVYTPGVASICLQIQADPELAWTYTGIQNTVAIVTNGTAVLGLGDIGAVAGMPVMEGKALLFHQLAGISGVPILLDSKDPDEIVAAVKAIAPTFGAIKLEDIRAPECFDIEARLDEALDIPVMHDDQHGTATVVLAALLTIARLRHLNLHRSTIGIIGLGAAGAGIHQLLKAYGVETVYGADINPIMIERFTARGGQATDLAGVMAKSSMVIATTGVPGLIKPEQVRKGQVILALSNPDPEILPDDALAAGAAFAADGKGVNNAMAFPGLFKGALRARATTINDAMKIAAAKAIAQHAMEGELMPNILDRSAHEEVARAVEATALKTGVVRFSRHLEP